MTRQTYPDNYYLSGQLPSPNIDNSELAARLGFGSIRRTGKVIFSDDFETSALGCWTIAGATVAIDSIDAWAGKNCAKFTPAVGPGFTATLSKYIPPLSRTMGVEFMLWYRQGLAVNNKPEYVEARLDFRSSLGTYTARLRIDDINNRIDYFNAAGVWVNLWPCNLGYRYPTYNNFKMVVDFNGVPKYRAFYFNDNYIQNTTSLNAAGAAAVDGIDLLLSVYDGTGTQYPAYIDNVVVTVDEF